MSRYISSFIVSVIFMVVILVVAYPYYWISQFHDPNRKIVLYIVWTWCITFFIAHRLMIMVESAKEKSKEDGNGKTKTEGNK